MRALVVIVTLAACSRGAEDAGLPVLGGGAHTMDAVQMREIDGLGAPTDLAFHPDVPDEIWAVGPDQDAVFVITDAHGSAQVDLRTAEGAEHFLSRPAALAFGEPGRLATIQDQDEVTQPETPDDFMGPTLWTSDPDEFEAGWASHYDMLHNSPDGLGIAWEQDNVYWVFDGFHGSLTRYDFGSDHGAAGADHSDGIIARYADGEVAGLQDVGAHLAYDPSTGLLYAADTGNSRIVALDTTTGSEGDTLRPNYDGAEQYAVDGATLAVVAADVLGDVVLDQPSGLEIHDGLLYVSDRATGFVFALKPDGTVVDFLATGVRNGLGGMAFDPDGHLWIADSSADRLIEISPVVEESR